MSKRLAQIALAIGLLMAIGGGVYAFIQASKELPR